MPPFSLSTDAINVAKTTEAIALLISDVELPQDLSRLEMAKLVTTNLSEVDINVIDNHVAIGEEPRNGYNRRSVAVVATVGPDSDDWVKASMAKHPSQNSMFVLPGVGGIKSYDGSTKATLEILPFHAAASRRVAMVRGVLLLSDSCNDERLKIFQAALNKMVTTVARATMNVHEAERGR